MPPNLSLPHHPSPSHAPNLKASPYPQTLSPLPPLPLLPHPFPPSHQPTPPPTTNLPPPQSTAAATKSAAASEKEASHSVGKVGPLAFSPSGGVAADDPNRSEGSWNQTIGSGKEALGGLLGAEGLKKEGERQNKEGRAQEAKGQVNDFGSGVQGRVHGEWRSELFGCGSALGDGEGGGKMWEGEIG